MSVERVKEYLRHWNAQDRILELGEPSATVELAAQALHCAPERIAKTLSFALPQGCLLIVAAGDARVDNAKFKSKFGCKARMIPPAEVEEKIGHAVGGVCPFGINAGVDVWLDESLRRFETVFPACGSGNSAIELSLAELEEYSQARGWADLCKGWQPDEHNG